MPFQTAMTLINLFKDMRIMILTNVLPTPHYTHNFIFQVLYVQSKSYVL